MVDTSVDGQVQRLQAMLYAKASNEPETQFKHLYKYLFRRQWVEAALERVMRNRGSRSPGVDGMTRSNVDEKGRACLIDAIIEELQAQTYQPQPTRRVYIPKANGKKRPLGIPTLKDRVVQQMVKMLIEPIFEAQFLPCSYGFRPNRCTWDALAEAYNYLSYSCYYHTVIEGDIHDCFGSINHARLMVELGRRLQDDRLLALLWNMLRAGVMEDLRYFETSEGTPQGGIVSPLLANVYLHALDEWFHVRFHALRGYQRYKQQYAGKLTYVRYIRYADDFIVLLRGTEEQATSLKQELAELVSQELKMTLSNEKTLITHASQGFDFLGVRTFVAPRWSDPGHWLPYQIPATKSVQSYRHKLGELVQPQYDYLPPGERIRAINRLVEGWANYHRWGNAKEMFSKLGWWTTIQVHRMLRRYMPGVGKWTTYEKYFWPVAECDNLKQWAQNTHCRTPSVDVGGGYRVGLVPMGLISTATYWKWRGTRIPAAFPLPAEAEVGSQRPIGFYTADEVVINAQVNHGAAEGYDAFYFLRRKEAFQRDAYTCTVCGYRSKRQREEVHDLECHHINPQGGHGLENLRTVCIPCHRRLTASTG
jgi:RNA-directed DNA polymerase